MSLLELPLEIQRQRLLPKKDAAEFLGCSVRHLNRLISAGNLKAFAINKRKYGLRLGDLLDIVGAAKAAA